MTDFDGITMIRTLNDFNCNLVYFFSMLSPTSVNAVDHDYYATFCKTTILLLLLLLQSVFHFADALVGESNS